MTDNSIGKYLKKTTQHYVNKFLNEAMNVKPLKNPDYIRFTNQERTQGVNSDGQLVTVANIIGNPMGGGLGHLIAGTNTYTVEGPKVDQIVVDGGINKGYLIVYVKDDGSKIYVTKLGDTTPYFWMDSPHGIAPFVVDAGRTNRYSITYNGKHLVNTYFDTTAGTFTTQVWMNFSLSEGSVVSDNIITFNGVAPNPTDSPNARQTCYTKTVDGEELVFIDYVLWGSFGLAFPPQRGIVFVDAVCPSLSDNGTTTAGTFADIWEGPSAFNFSFNILNLFRGSNDEASMTSNNTITVSYTNGFKYLWSKPIKLTQSTVAGKSRSETSYGDYVYDPLTFITSDQYAIPVSQYIPGILESDFIGVLTSAEQARGKFLDSSKFIVQLNNGPTDPENPSSGYNLKILTYTFSNGQWRSGKFAKGSTIVLNQIGSDGAAIDGEYALIDIGIV